MCGWCCKMFVGDWSHRVHEKRIRFSLKQNHMFFVWFDPWSWQLYFNVNREMMVVDVVVVVDIPYLWLLQCSTFSHLCLFRYHLLMWHDPHLFLDFVQILLGPSLSIFRFLFVCLLFDVVVVVLCEKSVLDGQWALLMEDESWSGTTQSNTQDVWREKCRGFFISRENRKFWSNHRFCNRRIENVNIPNSWTKLRQNKNTALHSLTCIHEVLRWRFVSLLFQSVPLASLHCIALYLRKFTQKILDLWFWK